MTFSLCKAERSRLAIILSALLLVACGGSAPPAQNERALPELSTPAANMQQVDNPEVDKYIQAQLLKQKIPGLSLAVVQGGKIIYAKGYGYASLESATPARPEQRFEIGSISKQFAATAVMMLVEEGKIALDEKVSKYIGAVPASWETMTVRHLLNHTSGLPEGFDPVFFKSIDNNVLYSDDQMLAIIKSYALKSAPGAIWAYSNVGYDIVGIMVSKVSGKYYGDFLQERIFTPLNMSSARILNPSDTSVGSATGYLLVGGSHVPEHQAPAVRHYLALAASSIEVSALDMAKWDAALYTEQLLKKSSLDQMWAVSALVQAQSGTMRADVNYGLGWFLSVVNGHRKVYHSGGMPAFTTDFIRYPDDKMSVVVLTNLDEQHSDPQSISREVARRFNTSLP